MLPSMLVNSMALSGVYTIDPNGSGSNNYNSFSAAVSDLTSEGVSSNVFFMVADGIYTDQIEIGTIVGASDTSMIIFRSASGIDTNVVLQYSATSSSDNWVVKFSAAKGIVFKQMTIKAQGNSYGRCFLFDGNSEHIMLDSLIIKTKLNATNYNHAPIFMIGGENHYNYIMNSIIEGGSHGVYMQGTSSLSNHGNIIYRNEISGFSNIGIYGSYNDSTMVAGNLVYYNTGSGTPKGIYLNYQTGESFVVSNGVVLDGGNTTYGIHVSGTAPSTTRGLIANNFVSVDGGSSTVGIRLYNLTNYDVYYNSVNTIGLNSTAALYHTGGSSIDIVNNILNKEGGNYTFYTNTPSSIGMADFNCFYNEDTTVAYWNGVRETLSDLQSVSNKFQNSIYVDPLFVSFTDFHVGQDSLDGAATPLARVTNDLDEEPRDATHPDIGADEFTVFNPFVEQTGITLVGLKNGSASWADYNNDGYLDILIAGETNNANRVSKIYKSNGNNTFTEQTSIVLQGVTYSAVDWGDYDNDGDLDILLTGKTISGASGAFSAIYKNNGNNTFSQQTAINLTGVYQGDVAWGDYDNDGDLDILMSGLNSTPTYITKIYRNDGSLGSSWSFVELTGLSLLGVYNSSLAWGDYDNDGDLDILLTGDNGATNISKVYQNNGASQGGGWSFVDQTTIALTGVSNSEADWGDIDNDGDLDILITGNNGYPLTKIYRNMGNNTFVYQANINIADVEHASFAWKDFDSNGTLDLMISGDTDTGFVSLGYRNAGGGNYVLEQTVVLENVAYGAMDAGDYDNDGDLDILIIGEDNSSNAVSKVYMSYIGADKPLQANLPPVAPTGLSSFVVSDSILFMWNTPMDNSTDSFGFTYNIQVGTSPNATDIYAPSANLITGKNLLAETGAILDTFCWIKLASSISVDTIFWSVQAVDLGFESSPFSYTHSCETSKYRASFIANPISFTAPPFNVTFTNTGKGYNSWSWNFGDASFSNQKNPTHTYLFNGSYDVVLYATDTTNNMVDTAMQTIVCTGGIPNPCAFTVELTQSQNSAMICTGDSIRLSATPMPNITYSWTHNGAVIPNSDDSIFYAKQAGFYMVVASNGSCSMLSTNYFVLDNFLVNPPLINVIGSIVPCSNDSLKLEASTGYSSYVWNNGKQGASIYTQASGYYSVEAIDGNGCSVVSQEKVINASLVGIPKICAVGVNPSTNHNVVSWQAVNTLKIDSFRVYKEATITNQFEYLGSVVYSASPEFEDVNSNVAVRQYKYRILAVDTCGTESPMSLSHKTMHLQVNAAINNHWNLIWQPYEGFSFASYKIYRGTDSLNMSLLATVSSNVTAYTDLNNPTGNIYYQIEIESASPCQAKSNATSRSNLFNTIDASGVGVEHQSANQFNVQVYPNPNKGVFTVSFFNKNRQHYLLRMYNQLGSIVLEHDFESQGKYNTSINAQSLAKGMYFIHLISNRQIVFYGKIIVE
jgi:hypothetical protein